VVRGPSNKSVLDPLKVVEAGYAWIEDEHAWLDGIIDSASDFGIGTGIAAYSVKLDGEPTVTAAAHRGTPDGFFERIQNFTTALSPDMVREMYAPTEFCGNAMYRLRRLAKKQGRSIDEISSGMRADLWALIAGDPRRRAVALVFPGDAELDPDRPFPKARVLGLAAAHLGAALRLRELAEPGLESDGITDSILDPSGKILHAIGAAKERGSRESLVEAVVRRERARGKLRRVDADEAAAQWAVLVAGKWSIVDFVDRDGKRLLLARKNPVAGPDIAALSEEERDVLWLATHGHTRKYIAYELGLSVAQVGRRLVSAMRKYKVSSRRELLRRFAGS
jgi:DNA-binding CsgD family transcriptional regulator